MNSSKATYIAEPFPRIRNATVDLLNAAKRKNMIHSIIEVDISKARETIRRVKRERKAFVSFTGYIISCVSEAVEANKYVHAYRNRKNQLILFDEVDVSTTIERKVNQRNEVVAMIIRRANYKSVKEISEEIRAEKSKKAEEAEVYGSIRLFLAIPAFIRQFVFRVLDKSPHLMKKRAGTVMVTSANMVGNGAGWGIPIASHTLNITIGSIVNRIIEVNGNYEKREHLCMTISFDHDIIDGAPAARFIRQLKKIIENGLI